MINYAQVSVGLRNGMTLVGKQLDEDPETRWDIREGYRKGFKIRWWLQPAEKYALKDEHAGPLDDDFISSFFHGGLATVVQAEQAGSEERANQILDDDFVGDEARGLRLRWLVDQHFPGRIS